MSGTEAAAAAGDGAPQRLPEQDQNADRGAARARAAQTRAEGVTAQSSPRTKGNAARKHQVKQRLSVRDHLGTQRRLLVNVMETLNSGNNPSDGSFF